MYGAIGLAIREAFDRGDEDSSKEWWEKTQKQITKDMVFTMILLMLGKPSENASVDVLNNIYYQHLRRENPDLTTREFEKEYAPITRYKSYDGYWWDYVGPFGAGPANVGEVITLYEDGHKIVPKEVAELALMTATVQALQLLGLMPADISNAIRSEYYKQRKGARENKGRNRRPACLDRSIPS